MSENVHACSDRETIEEEARRWLIRLDSDTPFFAEDANALREWVARSPAHRRELERIGRFWIRGNVLSELAIPLYKVKERRHGWRQGFWYSAANP